MQEIRIVSRVQTGVFAQKVSMFLKNEHENSGQGCLTWFMAFPRYHFGVIRNALLLESSYIYIYIYGHRVSLYSFCLSGLFIDVSTFNNPMKIKKNVFRRFVLFNLCSYVFCILSDFLRAI